MAALGQALPLGEILLHAAQALKQPESREERRWQPQLALQRQMPPFRRQWHRQPQLHWLHWQQQQQQEANRPTEPQRRERQPGYLVRSVVRGTNSAIFFNLRDSRKELVVRRREEGDGLVTVDTGTTVVVLY